mmetsp:Transcript_28009/g.65445  ORF Transcript_28009/g.65445 Transcript_28009/m.65445 type:complete len:213 (+) Transcript_28009:314-952(+)
MVHRNDDKTNLLRSGAASLVGSLLCRCTVRLQREVDRPKEEDDVDVQDTQRRRYQTDVHGRRRNPQPPVSLHRGPPVHAELALDRLLVLPLQGAQEDEDDRGEHRRLHELVNPHLCEVCRRDGVRRRRDGAVEQQVVEVVPRGLQHEAEDSEPQNARKVDARISLALDRLRCTVRSRQEHTRGQRFCEQRLGVECGAVRIPRAADVEHTHGG